jgi:hypothetical protein
MADTNPDHTMNTFETQAGASRTGLVAEFWAFIKHNKKYWLAPILLIVLAMGALILLSGTAAAPFIYTLF